MSVPAFSRSAMHGEGAQIGQADPHRFLLQRPARGLLVDAAGDDAIARLVEHIDPMGDEAAIARRGALEAPRQRRLDAAALAVAEHNDLRRPRAAVTANSSAAETP